MKKEIELQLIIKNPKEVERKLRKIGKFVGARKYEMRVQMGYPRMLYRKLEKRKKL